MAEAELTPLTTRAERVIDFYGDPIAVALGTDNTVYVPLRTITEFLGLDWSSQYKRIQRDDVLAERGQMVVITGTDGRPRPMFSLPLDLLPGWLFGITASRVRPELAPKLKRYRQDCFRVLWRAFEPEVLAPRPSGGTAVGPLVQVRELALAIAQMAEQQLALEHRVDTHADRLDKAAQVIRAFDRRLGALEEQLNPTAYLTDAQAADVAAAVKGLAELLTARDASKNQYQGVFAELYRRFRVSSYKQLRQDQYAAVLAFLADWSRSIQPANPTLPPA